MNRFTLLMAAFPLFLYACGSDDSGGGGGTGGKKDAGTDSGKGGTGGGTGATGGVGAIGGTGGVGGTITGGTAGVAGSGGTAGVATGGTAGAAGATGGTAGAAGSAQGGTAGTASGGTAGTAGASGASGSGGATGGVGGTDGGVSALGDTCGNPFIVGTLPYSTNGDTTGVGEDYGFTGSSCPPTTSDKGAGSPDHAYAFTPTSTGKYVVTLTSAFDAALYAVTDCQNIDTTCLAGVDVGFANDDEVITIDAQAGTTYFIIVDGYQTTPPGGAGLYTLTVEEAPPPPTNETCASALAFTTVPYQHTSNTTGTLNDYSITPGICGGISSSFTGAGASDLVYAFTPAQAGTYEVSVTTSTFDAMLYVSTNCAASPLTTCVAGSETSGSSGIEKVTLNATAGTTYYIFVDGYSTSSSPTNAGAYTLKVDVPPPPPANDTCATATAITAVPFSATGTTTTASSDYGFAAGTCQPANDDLGGASNDVVYSFVPALTGSYTITLGGFDTLLYVVTDCANITGATCLGGVDAGGSTTPETLTLNLNAGTTYYIMVDGYGDTSNVNGNYQLDVVKNP